jgi:hypothetical protein
MVTLGTTIIRAGEPRVRSAILIALMGLLTLQCSPSTPSAAMELSHPLCVQLAAVHDERAILGEPFRAAFDNDLDHAVSTAAGVRQRIEALLASLPPAAESSDGAPFTLRQAVVSEALVVDQAASWITGNGPDGASDDSIMTGGRRALEDGDESMRLVDVWAMDGPCTGLTYEIEPLDVPDVPESPDMQRLGLPVTIGGFELDVQAAGIEPGGLLATVIAEAGSDPSSATDVQVTVLDGVSEPTFDALIISGATLDAFANAAREMIWPLATDRTRSTMAGWDVLVFREPGESDESFFATSRNGVVYTFGAMTEDQLEMILIGLASS